MVSLRVSGLRTSWWLVTWNAAGVVVDVIALVAPGLMVGSECFKQKFVNPVRIRAAPNALPDSACVRSSVFHLSIRKKHRVDSKATPNQHV